MRKKVALLTNSLIYLVLSGGVVIVLLPIFWALLTACKQPGEGLKWNFWPKTMIESEWKNFKPQVQDKATLILEFNPALYPELSNIHKVAVAGTFNGWEMDRDLLQKEAGIWWIELSGLAPEAGYEYQFVVNGTVKTIDRANSTSQDGKSLYAVKPGRNANTLLSDATVWGQNGLEFRIRRLSSHKVTVETAEGSRLSLHGPDDQGYFTAYLPMVPTSQVRYRIWHSRSFADAVRDLYTVSNFINVLFNEDFPFTRFFLNSFLVATGTALLTVILCTMGGYVFAKKRFFLKDTLFMVLLSTMMVPGMIFMIPQFTVVAALGWMNSYQGMIVPHLANIFGLFLLKQHIATIPDSLFEAAKIDGAKEWQILRIIVFPLSLPIITTLFLLTFVGQWSNFLWQLIVNTPDSLYRTLPVGLALFKGQYKIEWEQLMAGACFSIIPIAILFLLAQKFFIAGLTQGAVKE